MALIDSYNPSQDATFRQRVQQSMLQQAGTVIAEAQTVAHHERRIKLVSTVVSNPGDLGDRFAAAIAGTTAVHNAYTSTTPVAQANVTDAQINTAVGGAWNAMSGAYV